MKNKSLLQKIIFALLISVSSFAFAQEDIQALANKWTKAYNAFDKEALGALYTEGAHLYVHGTPMIMGRESIEAFWEDDFAVENPKTVLIVTHSVEGYDMMLVHGNYQVLDRDSDEVLGQGRFAHIWHDVDGEWQLDQDLWNQPFE